MRIRKLARISQLYDSSSPNTLIQTHVCQLNQSPWDAMNFSPPPSPPAPPPPPYQGNENGDGNGIRNGESEFSVSVHERKLSPRRRSNEDTAAPPPPPPQVKNGGNIMCCKTDGKSWQCRREAAEGNSLCKHHLSMVKSYSSSVTHKKSGKPAEEAHRRTRPKKAATPSSLSNPYEFYYYSGFGPSWGKRRGETRSNNNANASIISKNVDEANVGVETAFHPGIDEFDFAEYGDEDDDEEEEEARNNGKKRVRKMIKARSLKSLQ